MNMGNLTHDKYKNNTGLWWNYPRN